MICPEAFVPTQEADAGGAVVGAQRVVLLGAAPELAPHERHHAVREARLLEVLLEGLDRQAVGLEVVAERPAISSECVSKPPLACSEQARIGRPGLSSWREPLEVARQPVVRRVDRRGSPAASC